MSAIRDIRSYLAGLIGPGIGKLYFVVDSRSGSYATFLTGSGIGQGSIYTDIQTAHDVAVTNRNDVICLYPGTYNQTAAITWSKSSTHLVGMTSPMQRTPAVTGTYGAAYITTLEATASGATSSLAVTGHYNQFHNFGAINSCAAGVGTIVPTGRVNLFKNLYIRGGEHATQLASAVLGYAVAFNATVAGHGNNNTFQSCHIGESRNTIITAGGQIYFATTGGISSTNQQIEFKDCFIQQVSATNACSAVFQTGNYAVDRHVLWENCQFYNFQTNLGTVLSGGVFTDTCGTTHMNLVRKCSQYGWEDWSSGTLTYIYLDMPIASGTGGTMLIGTTT